MRASNIEFNNCKNIDKTRLRVKVVMLEKKPIVVYSQIVSELIAFSNKAFFKRFDHSTGS
ncbi:MAG: hypothetical protein JRE27_04190 [Deltaproteobacteria bacterium]|nr:hypothetical protein [Deltaproteobacteria bacterium]